MKRILFTAIVGMTGVETRDQRVLVAPENDWLIKHRDYPLPVIDRRLRTEAPVIGKVSQVALCDRRIIAFGEINPEVLAPEEIEQIQRGYLTMIAEMSDIRIQRVTKKDQDFYGPAKRMVDWSISAVGLGTAQDSAWETLPCAQIEEINFRNDKEENHDRERAAFVLEV